MYNYIPHPSNARQASMCVSLLIEEGFAGYGLYWAMLEVLRDAPNYRYSPEPRKWAYVLHASDIDQVERVLSRYGLFDFDDDGLVFSPWLIEQLGAYDEKKRRRAEAGRKGAASRWGTPAAEDSKAIALPLHEDSNANANITNATNITNERIPDQPTAGGQDWRAICLNQGRPIEPEIIDYLAKNHQEGCAPGYLAQVCVRYNMGENVLAKLQELTENGNTTNSLYRKFCALVARIQREKWEPQQPANFFLSKLSE